MLYPRGVDRIDDVPWPLQEAINHGLSILSWHESYGPEDLPHENSWDDAQAIEEHFTAVRLKKEAERDGYHTSDDPDDNDMQQNDLAQVFKR